MKHMAVAVIVAFVSASSIASPVACSVRGDAIHWRADYCLFKSETDDILAVGPCLEVEERTRFRNSCVEKTHYKRLICQHVINSGYSFGAHEN